MTRINLAFLYLAVHRRPRAILPFASHPSALRTDDGKNVLPPDNSC